MDYFSYLVVDINFDLINFYKKIVVDCEVFIFCVKVLFEEVNSELVYYNIRQEFNYLIEIIDFMKVIYFLYFNCYGYCGLCCYNKSGYFNIFYGNYKNLYFFEKEICVFVEKVQWVMFICVSFDEMLVMLQVGDVVYCDLLYDGMFFGYYIDGFIEDDQYYLVFIFEYWLLEGYLVIVFNNDIFLICLLYCNFIYYYIKVKCSIGVLVGEGKFVIEIIVVFGLSCWLGFDFLCGVDSFVVYGVCV